MLRTAFEKRLIDPIALVKIQLKIEFFQLSLTPLPAKQAMHVLEDYPPFTFNGTCAREVARRWLSGYRYFAALPRHSQTRACLERLFNRCIAESNAQGDDIEAFESRLDLAANVVWKFRHSIWSKKDRDFDYFDPDKMSDEQKASRKPLLENLWFRHDPRKAFADGYESVDYIDFFPDDIEEVVSSYLEYTWMSDPYFEYLAMDALISREICACGQEVKFHFDPISGLIKDLPTFASLRHGGNLEKYRNAEAYESLKMLGARLLFLGLGLSGLIFVHMGTVKSSGYYVIVGLSIAAILVALLSVASSYEPKDALLKQQIETEKWRRLQSRMFAVWQSLAGPVVSPERVQQCMIAAGEEGAVWNNACWVLIARAIARDPHVWIVEPKRDPWL